MTESQKTEDFEKLKQEIIDYILFKNIIPNYQQIDEPDLNNTNKKEIFIKILDKSPVQFLYRFGQYLLPNHLEYFESNQVKQCYSVKYLVANLKRQSTCSAKTSIRNRRFQALVKIINEGVYFSDAEMKKRNPLMYELLVEKYLSKEEKEEIKSINQDCKSLTEVLEKQIENEYTNDLKELQRNTFEQEELDSSDEDCEEDSSEESDSISQEKKKQLLKEEFRSMMYSQFLEGNDTEFDYSKIDENQEMEMDVIENQDNEDKYFDSETPNEISPQDCSEEEDELDVYMNSLKTD